MGFDRNSWLRRAEFDISQLDQRFDARISALLPFEPWPEYVPSQRFWYSEQSPCRKRLWAQDLSIVKFSFSRHGYRFSKAFAVAIATRIDNSFFISSRLEIILSEWVDFVTQKTRTSSQLFYNNFLGRFLFAKRIFDFSLVTLSKSTNCTSFRFGKVFSIFWSLKKGHKYLHLFQSRSDLYQSKLYRSHMIVSFSYVLMHQVSRSTTPNPKKLD